MSGEVIEYRRCFLLYQHSIFYILTLAGLTPRRVNRPLAVWSVMKLESRECMDLRSCAPFQDAAIGTDFKVTGQRVRSRQVAQGTDSVFGMTSQKNDRREASLASLFSPSSGAANGNAFC